MLFSPNKIPDLVPGDLTTTPTAPETTHQTTQTHYPNDVNATHVTNQHHVTDEEEKGEDDLSTISTEIPSDVTMDGHDDVVNTTHADVSSDPEVTGEEENFPTFPSLTNDTFGPQSIRFVLTHFLISR